ncbi:hypothetical protein HOK51_11470 [Candidatus Woesearchaeota archaeon]|jgi:hypothetical protein|nr:hypothetical protein [Candidatus Woesearchaeota archaeon]MBT6520441.1 hypothetical protein [Candidatus Woesearchaeota archaeon]MBT7367335.1 hypothetical protein [Candidatus Woesearchaeota archaeon]
MKTNLENKIRLITFGVVVAGLVSSPIYAQEKKQNSELKPWLKLADKAIAKYGSDGKIGDAQTCYFLQEIKQYDEDDFEGREEARSLAKTCAQDRELIQKNGNWKSKEKLNRAETARVLRQYWKAYE